jgi:hypothetical protein
MRPIKTVKIQTILTSYQPNYQLNQPLQKSSPQYLVDLLEPPTNTNHGKLEAHHDDGRHRDAPEKEQVLLGPVIKLRTINGRSHTERPKKAYPNGYFDDAALDGAPVLAVINFHAKILEALVDFYQAGQHLAEIATPDVAQHDDERENGELDGHQNGNASSHNLRLYDDVVDGKRAVDVRDHEVKGHGDGDKNQIHDLELGRKRDGVDREHVNAKEFRTKVNGRDCVVGRLRHGS